MSAPTTKDWALGVDIGGTFTDVVALDYAQGKLHSLKVLTTHGDPTEAVIDGVQALIQSCDIDPSRVTRVVHATTLFTNALIERGGVRTGLLATEGFSDVIEIGHERKYDLYDLAIERAPALVPRNLRAEIKGRLDADGRELEALDPAGVREAVQRLVELGVESIAVCLLHSYASASHEKAVAEWVRRDFPSVELTLSSDVAPVIREFERISTTVANAYIRPLATRYLDSLEKRLLQLGPALRGADDAFQRWLVAISTMRSAIPSSSSNPALLRAPSPPPTTECVMATPTCSPSTWAERRPSSAWSNTRSLRSLSDSRPRATSDSRKAAACL